jgi:mpaB/rubber oxygenase-like protein
MSEIPWTAEQLEPYRAIGDPIADEVVAELYRTGQVPAINALLKDLVLNEYPEPAAAPPMVARYLDQTDDLPQWADRLRIEAGEKLFWRHGPKLVMVLHCYSLPFCYCGGNGAQVLNLTTRLESNPTRRILETAQLLVDVMQPGGLTGPQGRGRRTLQKVRLMHAAVRRLAKAAPTWQASWGLPINQEDLGGTLMAFSWVGLDGLAKLGVDVSADEREAYLHCWNVAGWLLGVRRELLPRNEARAADLVQAIAHHQFASNQAGRDLTAALVHHTAYHLPGNAFEHFAPVMIRYFIGEERASMLGLQPGPGFEQLSGLMKILQIDELLAGSRALAAVMELAGRKFLETALFIERGGNRPTFAIPQELRQVWGVNWVG